MNRALPPLLFMFGLGLTVAFWPGTVDAPLTIRWAIAAAMTPLFIVLFGTQSAPIPKLPAMFVAGAAASLAWTSDFYGGIDDLAHLMIVLAAFWLGASIKSLRAVWLGLAVGMAINAVIVVAQWSWGLDLIGQSVSPGGLFGNKNFSAEASMIALIVALGLGGWMGLGLAVYALVAIALCSSKAVFAALIVAAAFWLMPRHRKVGGVIVALMATAAVVVLLLPTDSAAARFPIWQAALSDFRLLGHGVGSFAGNYPIYEHAHSEPLQFIYEFGLLAVLPVVIFWQVMEGWRGEVEGFILVAVGAVAIWSFPLHMPVTAFAAAIAAGHLARLRSLMVERRDSVRFALGVGA